MQAAEYDAAGPQRGMLRVVDLPPPVPGPGEVRVRMRVSGVNPTDVKARTGMSNASVPTGAVVPHHDGAGVIDMVGPGADPERTGQRVWVYQAQWGGRQGTAAQWTVVPARQAVPLPDSVSFDHGAGLGIPAMTAHWGLFADGPLQNQTVLIHGGAGAVGHAAVQLARWAGARVAATVSSPEKAQLARDAGAHEVIDYRREDVVQQIRHWSSHGVDRIMDVDLEANLARDAELIADGGTIVSYQRPTAPLTIPSALPARNVAVRFVLIYTIAADAKLSAVEYITRALAAGVLKPLPTVRFELADVALAHEAVERGAGGKVLIDIP